MTCYHRNLTINDLVSNHELSLIKLRFNHEFDHIVSYKEDRPLDILKTCYENLDKTHLKVYDL